MPLGIVRFRFDSSGIGRGVLSPWNYIGIVSPDFDIGIVSPDFLVSPDFPGFRDKGEVDFLFYIGGCIDAIPMLVIPFLITAIIRVTKEIERL